jgi:hypothetical protein
MLDTDLMYIEVSPEEIPRLLRGTYQVTVFNDGESIESPLKALHLEVRVGGLKNSRCGGLLAARIQENLGILARTALQCSSGSEKHAKLTVEAIREMVRVELAHLPRCRDSSSESPMDA